MQGPRVYLLYGVDPKQQKHNGENTKRQKKRRIVQNGESYKTANTTKQQMQQIQQIMINDKSPPKKN